jgi:hypothetical protein
VRVNNKKNYDEQLSAIMNRLAESVLELSDDQVLAEEREKGIDPTKEAESIRNVLRHSSKMQRMQKLQAAERAYEENVARLNKNQYQFPDSPTRRKQLLAAVFAAKPDVQSVLLTAQHRDFEQLTDVDVESLLRQLADLGILESFK